MDRYSDSERFDYGGGRNGRGGGGSGYGDGGGPLSGFGNGLGGAGGLQKRRVCRFCGPKPESLDYLDGSLLRHFISERGKILPRRMTGTCAKHQREVARSVKRARVVSLLPYSID